MAEKVAIVRAVVDATPVEQEFLANFHSALNIGHTVPGTKAVAMFKFADGATAALSKTVPPGCKFKVLNVTGVKTDQAGAAGDTVTLYKGLNAVSDAISLNVADQVQVKSSTLNDLYFVFDGDAGDSIKLLTSGTKCNCEVYVELLRVK